MPSQPALDRTRDWVLRGVRARVLSPTHSLGPFGTPAAALRWRVNGPGSFWCVRSGWVGSDLTVELDDGQRVMLPLSILRIDATHIWSPEQLLPPVVPEWVGRLRARGGCWWWEVPIQHDSIVELDATLDGRIDDGYRAAARASDVVCAKTAVLRVLPTRAASSAAGP